MIRAPWRAKGREFVEDLIRMMDEHPEQFTFDADANSILEITGRGIAIGRGGDLLMAGLILDNNKAVNWVELGFFASLRLKRYVRYWIACRALEQLHSCISSRRRDNDQSVALAVSRPPPLH